MKYKNLLALTATAFIIAGCSAFQQTDETPAEAASPDPAQIETMVAGTVEAALTEIANAQPSNTPEPTNTPEPADPTEAPTEAPTALPAIEEPLFANQARYIEDVTIPDGTLILAGEPFTKVWRIQNIGTETWTTEYAFVFVNGNRMEGQAIKLPNEVAPGETIDISIAMIAPFVDGVYTGYWMFSTPDGEVFGFGEDAFGAVNVTIDVFAPTAEPLPTETATPEPTATP